jgi:putative peptide zinc metalloprotease protein
MSNSLASSTSRPLSVKMRADLVITSQRYQGRVCWTIKDPLTLRYYRLEEEEYFLLVSLDGTTSLDAICRNFEKRFAPQELSPNEAHRFIAMLYRSSLVVSDAPGQTDRLLKQRADRQSKERIGKLTNFLGIRFRGIDPDRLLTALNKFTWVLFTKPAVYLCAMLWLSALALAFTQWDSLVNKLPTFQTFFSASNWIWLAVALAGTKVLHEFGHGLCCKRFRGNVTEMGVMLLIFTPCLYCNVTDSWLFRSKWQRAAVGAAGMYVELTLAALACWLWWFSQPGLIHYMALNVVFVSSLSTLLFNANPLLKFDGYYILSDILEIPNLRQKATKLLHQKLAKICLGLSSPPDPFLPAKHQTLFALFSVAAAAYRVLITFSILLLLNRIFTPYGLQFVGRLLMLAAVANFLLIPAWKLFRYLSAPGRIGEMSTFRLAVTSTVMGATVAAALCIPLPYYVYCPFQLEARKADPALAEVGGQLIKIHAHAGDSVNAGDPLVTLENRELTRGIQSLEGKRDELATRLHQLRFQSLRSDDASLAIQPLEKELAATIQELEGRKLDAARLIVRAPQTGIVYPASYRPPADPDSDKLPTWHGLPIDEMNNGTWLSGVEVARVGGGGALSPILFIDQSDLELVYESQKVDLFPHALPGVKLSSKLLQKADEPTADLPVALGQESGGTIQTEADASGKPQPVNPHYEALGKEVDQAALMPGATGIARIYVGNKTVGWRLLRLIQQTFATEVY